MAIDLRLVGAGEKPGRVELPVFGLVERLAHRHDDGPRGRACTGDGVDIGCVGLDDPGGKHVDRLRAYACGFRVLEDFRG